MHTGIDTGFGCTAIVSLNDNLEIVKSTFFGANYTKDLKKIVHDPISFRLKKHLKYFSDYFIENSIIGTIIIEQPIFDISKAGNGILVFPLFGAYLARLFDIVKCDNIYTPKPTAIKKAFTGKGNANKDKMKNQYEQIIGEKPPNDHVSDAFAMAWCKIKGLL
jgi:hypothetical protein